MEQQPEIDGVFTQLAEVIVDIAREIQLHAAETTPVVPLTPTQGQVMRYVHRNPGCSASDIADGARLQRTNVSTALRELRARGYLTSLRDEQDGRAIRITATELADETIAKLTAAWAGLLQDAWGGVERDTATAVAVSETLTGVRDRLSAEQSADRATKGYASATPSRPEVGEDSSHPS